MKHIITLLIVILFSPMTLWSQEIDYEDIMHHDDDTIDVKYTKEMLQGKVWEIDKTKVEVEDDCDLNMIFKGDSLLQICIVHGKKYIFPCVYFLSDSYLMDYDDEECSNQTGKYLQVKCLDTECDGTGRESSMSYWIRKLSDDTLEIVEWRSQKSTDSFRAKKKP